jgi:hypothetical protein
MVNVSFIGFILLTKSLSCNDVVLIGIPYYFRSLYIFRVYFSNMEKWPYYDKFQCHKFQEGNFRFPRRFCEVSNSAKVGSLVPVWMV